jgi:hypothetical protein
MILALELFLHPAAVFAVSVSFCAARKSAETTARGATRARGNSIGAPTFKRAPYEDTQHAAKHFRPFGRA